VFGFCGVLGIDDDVMTPYVLCSGLILFLTSLQIKTDIEQLERQVSWSIMDDVE